MKQNAAIFNLELETQPLVERHLNRGLFAAVVLTDNQPNAGGDLEEETQPLVERHLNREPWTLTKRRNLWFDAT